MTFGRETPILSPGTRVIVRISAQANSRCRAAEHRLHAAQSSRPRFRRHEHHTRRASASADARRGPRHRGFSSRSAGTLSQRAFSFSPAIADGTLHSYTMCDWIDNAITLQMGHGEGQVYGYLHLPCRVEVNARLAGFQEPPSHEHRVHRRTGRFRPGRCRTCGTNTIARYAFATRFCEDMRVLDAGCGTGYGSHALSADALSVIGYRPIARKRLRYAADAVSDRSISAGLPAPARSFRSRCGSFDTGRRVRSDRTSSGLAEAALWKRGVS